MYEKPKLERFGTFRELTQLGLDSDADGFAILGIGCKVEKYEWWDTCQSGRS